MIGLSILAVMAAVALLWVIVVGALRCVATLEQRVDKLEGGSWPARPSAISSSSYSSSSERVIPCDVRDGHDALQRVTRDGSESGVQLAQLATSRHGRHGETLPDVEGDT